MQAITCEDGEPVFPPRPFCPDCSKKTNYSTPFLSPDNQVVHSKVVGHDQEDYNES